MSTELPIPEIVYEPYKIYSLISDRFKTYPIENIDFARMLRPDKALSKTVEKQPNGRPDKALYYDGADLVAEIDFVFVTNSDNLLSRRSENLYYYRVDGTKSDAILIKDKIFNFANLVDGEIAVKEREDARKAIVSSMKAFLGGVMQQALTLPLADVVLIIKPFWDEHNEDRNEFIELGSHDWKNAMIAIDLATTPHTFLSIVIDGAGTTMRDYIVYRLSY